MMYTHVDRLKNCGLSGVLCSLTVVKMRASNSTVKAEIKMGQNNAFN